MKILEMALFFMPKITNGIDYSQHHHILGVQY